MPIIVLKSMVVLPLAVLLWLTTLTVPAELHIAARGQDGWVTGHFRDVWFEAKVYDSPSCYGWQDAGRFRG